MNVNYERAYLRERKAREEAEEILESKTRELFLKNEQLLSQYKSLEVAHSQLKETQTLLVQSEKMASLGIIAAGVAHEINNPVAYVTSNLNTLSKYIENILKFFGIFEKIKNQKNSKSISDLIDEANQFAQEQDMLFILEDIKQLICESQEGASRVKEIVQNLKSFARLDEAKLKEANINDCIETTLKVIWNEIKYKCKVEKKLNQLPIIKCYPGQLNQVFMNLFVNASQAIQESGTLSVSTSHIEGFIIVKVSDTGHGIHPENLKKLFTPFFTTKPVGKGTGLGLSVSFGIIQRHNGKINVESTPGKGTTFTIHLPTAGALLEARAA